VGDVPEQVPEQHRLQDFIERDEFEDAGTRLGDRGRCCVGRATASDLDDGCELFGTGEAAPSERQRSLLTDRAGRGKGKDRKSGGDEIRTHMWFFFPDFLADWQSRNCLDGRRKDTGELWMVYRREHRRGE
jgi:hypothetical protein